MRVVLCIAMLALVGGAEGSVWGFPRWVDVPAGASHYEQIGVFGGMSVVEGTVLWRAKNGEAEARCGEYKLDLFTVCVESGSAAGLRIALMNGTCPSGSCTEPVAGAQSNCTGLATYYAVLTNANTACNWEASATLTHQCPSMHYGPICLPCTPCSACSCNGNAVLENDACTCTCGNFWSGPTCSTCPAAYSGSHCNQCGAKYIYTPDGTACEACPQASCPAGQENIPDTSHMTCSCGVPVCDPGFILQGGTCTQCSLSQHCSGHAVSVLANIYTSTCDCLCRSSWGDSNCGTCPAQYDGLQDCALCEGDRIQYPTCTMCTNDGACSGRATNTYGLNDEYVPADSSKTACVCTCKNQWSGPTCGVCDINYGGTDCDACSAEYANYPDCTRCHALDHCNDRGLTAIKNTEGTCTCTCRNKYLASDNCKTCPVQYGGTDCDRCATGYTGWPECDACTVEADCSGHATAVTSNGGAAGLEQCVCTCANSWGGDNCAACDATLYDAPQDCGACITGRYGYPACTVCDVSHHCSDHADSVTELGDATCQCACHTGYEQPSCDTCVAGYAGYPQCAECTVQGSCSGRASQATVSADKSVCECTCLGNWDVPDCSVCKQGFTGADCGSCLDGHVGAACRQCTSEADCSGHAEGVTSTAPHDVCVCTCRNQYLNLMGQCDYCSSTYTGDCDQCAGETVGYPDCRSCSTDLHCSGHASAVAYSAGTCGCTCRNKWGGSDCGQCSLPYQASPDCNTCADGYIGYPVCTQCDVDTHCSGHAGSVSSSASRDTCVCGCRNYWTGDFCETCPTTYGGSDCDTCSATHVGTPGTICIECNNFAHCNGRATSVEANPTHTACQCTCGDQWGGDSCGVCSDPNKYSSTCDSCKAGYINYPACTLCTAADCSDHAVPGGVSSNADRTVCACTCADGWDGATCATCPANYLQDGNCNDCADGFFSFPECRPCNLEQDCSGHAGLVEPTPTGCKCTCSGNWEGDSCDACPSQYEQTACEQCAADRITYPTCTLCATDVHCSNHATSATTSDHLVCTCVCADGWSEADCSVCPVNYEQQGDACSTCAAGYAGTGCALCTIAEHCNGADKASAVDSSPSLETCTCTCRNQWDPVASCAACPQPYAGSACDECTSGWYGYPTCTECTVSEHCSDHATSVTSNPSGSSVPCACTCTHKWEGSACATCPHPYLASPECNACKQGYINYSTCQECTSVEHCNGHASTVTSNADGSACACTCSTGYTGDLCDECSAGFVGYPTCTLCTPTSVDCAGRATQTVPNANNDACVCDCLNAWTGDLCSECDPKYDAATCSQCGTGRVAFPECTQCVDALHCSGNGVAAANTDATACMCSCSTPWTSTPGAAAMCDVCPQQFAGDLCDTCAPGYHTYPLCNECLDAVHCNGRATSVMTNAAMTGCTCTCRNYWVTLPGSSGCGSCPAPYGGDECETCMEGYVYDGGAGTCTQCTPDVHCSSHAAQAGVTDDGTRSSCVCTQCLYKWEGAQCQTCPPNYQQSTCSACAEGHVVYPTCTQCSVDVHCSSQASNVVTDTQKVACLCACVNKWSGDQCAECVYPYTGSACNECAAGYYKEPVGDTYTCKACSVAEHCNGNAASVASSPDGLGCACTCGERHEGAACALCRVGYIDYSAGCVRCTSLQHCSNRASAVTSNAAQDACDCVCTSPWSGDTCATCPAIYNTGCTACGPGRISFPQCTQCDVDVHCNGHAVSVAVDSATDSCVCTCMPEWSGTSTCSKCSVTHYGPMCTLCSSAQHCNGNAAGVVISNAAGDGCVCGACTVYWEGSACGECPSKYSPTCDSCAAGLVGPDCIPCSVAVHCGAGAATVTTMGDACECGCRNKWAGARCDDCFAPYTGTDCDECVMGYVWDGAVCVECSLAGHCSSNAISVTSNSDSTQCLCTCRHEWNGDDCSQCPSTMAGDCDRCAQGYINFPSCTECDNTQHCVADNSNGAMSNAAANGCTCLCKGQWQPAAGTTSSPGCNICPDPYEGPMCDRCKAGYAGYPDCVQCLSSTHCSNRAAAVTVVDNACVCECSAHWEGEACQVCPVGLISSTCDACEPGYIDYPSCTACTSADHCNGQAVSVTTDDGQTACQCVCARPWEGDSCGTCPSKAEGPDCDKCAPGRINYPVCTECLLSSCNSRAATIGTDTAQEACECDCYNRWSGSTCDVCPLEYKGAGCDECSTGRIQYPVCTPCTTTVHCSGRAEIVDANEGHTVCICEECIEGYTGSNCHLCDVGYRQAATVPEDCERDPAAWCVGDPGTVANGLPALCTDTTALGGTCELHCAPGYRAVSGYICTAEGWDTPVCEEAPCNAQPPAVEFGSSQCALPVAAGETCGIICITGYSPQGSYLCKASEWIELPTCDPDPCQDLPAVPQHGLGYPCSTPAASGASCNLQCAQGYVPAALAVCHAGAWSVPECAPEPCSSQPPAVTNGKGDCVLPTASGGECPLLCDTASVSPPRCSRVEDLDVSDNFITLDGGEGVGLVCFEWVPEWLGRDDAQQVCQGRGGWLAFFHNMVIETGLHDYAGHPQWWTGIRVEGSDGARLGSFEGGDAAVAGWWNEHYTNPLIMKGGCCPGIPEHTGDCIRYNTSIIPGCPYEATTCDVKHPFWCMYWDVGTATVSERQLFTNSSSYSCHAGAWSVPSPACTPLPCEEQPLDIQHALSPQCSLPAAHDQQCTPSCDAGYTATSQHICDHGQWSLGACEPDHCTEQPTTVPHGTQPTCLLPKITGAACTLSCEPGYQPTAPYTCKAGSWVAGECVARACTSQPPRVPRGSPKWQQLPAPSGTTAELVCVANFVPSGVYLCEAGSWAEPLPSCVPRECGVLPSIPNSVRHTCGEVTDDGGVCDIECGDGYADGQGNNVHEATCVRGSWRFSLCAPAPCVNPPGAVAGQQYSCKLPLESGSSCAISCNSGHVTVSDWVCLSGSWSSSGICIAKPCTEPPQAVEGGASITCALPADHGTLCSAEAGCVGGRTPSADYQCSYGRWILPTCKRRGCPPDATCAAAPHGSSCPVLCDQTPAVPRACNDGTWSAVDCPSEAWVRVVCCADRVPLWVPMRCTAMVGITGGFEPDATGTSLTLAGSSSYKAAWDPLPYVEGRMLKRDFTLTALAVGTHIVEAVYSARGTARGGHRVHCFDSGIEMSSSDGSVKGVAVVQQQPVLADVSSADLWTSEDKLMTKTPHTGDVVAVLEYTAEQGGTIRLAFEDPATNMVTAGVAPTVASMRIDLLECSTDSVALEGGAPVLLGKQSNCTSCADCQCNACGIPTRSTGQLKLERVSGGVTGYVRQGTLWREVGTTVLPEYKADLSLLISALSQGMNVSWVLATGSGRVQTTPSTVRREWDSVALRSTLHDGDVLHTWSGVTGNALHGWFYLQPAELPDAFTASLTLSVSTCWTLTTQAAFTVPPSLPAGSVSVAPCSDVMRGTAVTFSARDLPADTSEVVYTRRVNGKYVTLRTGAASDGLSTLRLPALPAGVVKCIDPPTQSCKHYFAARSGVLLDVNDTLCPPQDSLVGGCVWPACLCADKVRCMAAKGCYYNDDTQSCANEVGLPLPDRNVPVVGCDYCQHPLCLCGDQASCHAQQGCLWYGDGCYLEDNCGEWVDVKAQHAGGVTAFSVKLIQPTDEAAAQQAALLHAKLNNPSSFTQDDITICKAIGGGDDVCAQAGSHLLQTLVDNTIGSSPEVLVEGLVEVLVYNGDCTERCVGVYAVLQQLVGAFGVPTDTGDQALDTLSSTLGLCGCGVARSALPLQQTTTTTTTSSLRYVERAHDVASGVVQGTVPGSAGSAYTYTTKDGLLTTHVLQEFHSMMQYSAVVGDPEGVHITFDDITLPFDAQQADVVVVSVTQVAKAAVVQDIPSAELIHAVLASVGSSTLLRPNAYYTLAVPYEGVLSGNDGLRLLDESLNAWVLPSGCEDVTQSGYAAVQCNHFGLWGVSVGLGETYPPLVVTDAPPPTPTMEASPSPTDAPVVIPVLTRHPATEAPPSEPLPPPDDDGGPSQTLVYILLACILVFVVCIGLVGLYHWRRQLQANLAKRRTRHTVAKYDEVREADNPPTASPCSPITNSPPCVTPVEIELEMSDRDAEEAAP